MLKKILATLTALLCLAAAGITVQAADPAEVTVDGEGFYFVTGESYPTSVVISGYNSRDKELFLNVNFETKKTVDTGKTATFSYYADVFDGTSTSLGNVGSLITPETQTGAAGATTASVTNKSINLSDLTTEFRIVVTVASLAVSP